MPPGYWPASVEYEGVVFDKVDEHWTVGGDLASVTYRQGAGLELVVWND